MDDATLTKAICAALGTVPGWNWTEDPDTEYPTDEVGIYYGAIAETPDRAIGIRLYSVPSDDENTARTRRIQARIRGARRDRDDADQIASVLRTVLPRMRPPAGVALISYYSTGDLGPDNNQREQRTENFTIILDNQESTS